MLLTVPIEPCSMLPSLMSTHFCGLALTRIHLQPAYRTFWGKWQARGCCVSFALSSCQRIQGGGVGIRDRHRRLVGEHLVAGDFGLAAFGQLG